jgi:hypothetical protein
MNCLQVLVARSEAASRTALTLLAKCGLSAPTPNLSKVRVVLNQRLFRLVFREDALPREGFFLEVLPSALTTGYACLLFFVLLLWGPG